MPLLYPKQFQALRTLLMGLDVMGVILKLAMFDKLDVVSNPRWTDKHANGLAGITDNINLKYSCFFRNTSNITITEDMKSIYKICLIN